MLTLNTLEEYGADVRDGMRRCLDNEAFYLRLVKTAAETTDLEALKTALDHNDLDRAFELCHAMKGMFGNLSLTPLAAPAGEMTEMLRARRQADYTGLFSELEEQMRALQALCV